MKTPDEIAALIMDELSVEDGCGLKLRWLHDQIVKAILDEREACAKVCEEEFVDAEETRHPEDFSYNMALEHAAEAIRQRK